VASADEAPEIVDLFQVQIEEGPGVDAWRSGAPVGHPDLRAAEGRWPRFAEKASAAGFTATYAVPMRLRAENIGVLSLFKAGPGELDGDTARAAKAMVDVATIGLLQARAMRHHEVLVEQLQAALTSRVVIEQAKGFVSERLGIDLATAFVLLRGHSRRNGRRLTDVARAVVTRAEDVRELLGPEADRT
jgi:hypothetical protein